MNIALEQTEEYVNGQLKNKYGDAFIRGNNGTGGTSSGLVVGDSQLSMRGSPFTMFSLVRFER